MSNYYNDPLAQAPREPKQPTTAWLWPLVLLMGLTVALVYVWRSHWQQPLHDANAQPRAVAPRGDLSDSEQATINLFKDVSPCVVHITTLALRQDIFSMDVFQIPRGTGSGFIWDDKGNIVTNYHVIQGANAAKVTLYDQTTYDAVQVGTYPDQDIAVLRIDAPAKKLKPLKIGTSHDLQVGQRAFAIGNPFGLDQTLTTGIVSALGRAIKSANEREIKDVIQTDAAINPGNSGGPLLDSSGRLIGVNTAIFSPSGTSAGIGFAIPVDEVNRTVPELIRTGRVIRPTLGIQPADDQVMQKLELDGVLILYENPDGPAAKSGLRPTRRDARGRIRLGDIIVAIDGKPIKTKDDMYSVLEAHKVGETVPVTVIRDEEKQTVQVTLGAASD
jgi:S1-C subfamily serine protease